MMSKTKSFKIKARLPTGVVEKLSQNKGGGTHASKKKYNRKRKELEIRVQAKEAFPNPLASFWLEHPMAVMSQREQCARCSFKQTRRSKMSDLKCVACDKTLDSYAEIGSPLQPVRGIMCYSQGNYGSTVFDSIDGSETLHFVLCDECVKKKEGSVYITLDDASPPIPGIEYFKE